MYHFHCDEEALAWRIIGQVARMCIELGLHRRDSLFRVVTDEDERSNAIKLFWSIYVLDRRWSFGTGMPFALQDADIDPNLPEPVSLQSTFSTLLDIDAPAGFNHSLPQRNDFLQPNWIQSLAICLLLLATTEPNYELAGDWLSRLPDPPMA
jgi:hypothetical protein